ncbi:MAG: tRNA (N(6)-L-threonylcarbamoyladenosine(37)-C(2))-methylthiotransferase MtaB [Thermoanaerobaculia bacterium]|nr:tRNA (N(6)-L-threonylcarbamoyladenosine(37)-C(2))-methylthiotransferase MtaB [Thermoanaerobaculia bacterium]
MRVYLSNLGCKLNQAETDGFARRFQERGHAVVDSLAEADVHVVNSCTVTHHAARDSRKAARRAARREHRAKTVLTGCFAAASPLEARRLAGVDLVVGNDEKERLVDLVEARFGPAPGPVPVSYVPLPFGRTRALVKIEDGCNMSCAFCIIPSTRGRQRSRPVEEVLAEVRDLAAAGYREIVLTGVQISSYRDGANRLADLIETVLEGTEDCRFRLTSIAPWDFSPRLLPLLASDRVCRHVHFSLQSGSAGVLERMRRPYTPDSFAALVAEVRERIAGIAVTTDVIVGFPGESDAEHRRSLDFVAGLDFARVHAFTFSAREGTAAASLPGQVPAERKKARMREMLAVADRAAARFRRRQAGGLGTVLWEEERGGCWRGMSDNYLRAFTYSDLDLRGRLTRVRLGAPRDDGLEVELAA